MHDHLRILKIIGIAAAAGMTVTGGEAQAQSAGAVAGKAAAAEKAASTMTYSCNYVNAEKLCGVETFSRTGASASMFDSTGQLTFAPNNLLLYSNTFSDPKWASVSAEVTPNAKTDPFGGNDGWSMQTRAASGSFYRQSVAVEPGLNYVNTLYLAPGSATWARIDRFDISAHASWINLSTCVAGTTASETMLTVTAVAGGWCKVDQAFIPDTTTVHPTFTSAVGDKGENANGASIYVYGEQLSLVTYQTAIANYYPTGAAGYYGPRFGYIYNGSTWVSAGMLLEDFRTNYLKYSNDLTGSVWVRGSTMTVARDQLGVDGVVNGASSLTGGAVSATNTICQSAKVSYHDRVFSTYAKRISGRGVVNMATDAKTESGAGATWHAMTITPNWTRVSFLETRVTNPITCFQIVIPGDKIAVQYVQNENVPNETRTLTATYPISTTSSFVSRGGETLTSASPTLLGANAFVVETSGQQPEMDLAMLGLANVRDELSIGLGEKPDNTLYSTFPFPSLSTTNTGTWIETNRAGIAWGTAPIWSAISLNGGIAANGTGVYDALKVIYWGTEPGGGKNCNCFIRSWATYSILTNAQLSAKTNVGAAY